MRNPVAIGFYPASKDVLRNTIDSLFSRAKKADCAGAIGAIVPHASYAYSGLTASHVYASLAEKYETIILLGTNHTGYGKDIAVSLEDWQTPLGVVKNDIETGKEICKLSRFCVHDELAHAYEHSIEVQLPFLQQAKLKEFSIVPLAVSSGIAPEQYADLAEAIKKVAKEKKALVIASSDFTHYGMAYGFAPETKDANKWVHETDRIIIRTILSGNAERFIDLAEKSTVCGAGAIATLIHFAGKKKGNLLDYRTSCDVSGDKSAIVGYAGIVF